MVIVRLTLHLEVGDGAQIVIFNVFREVEDDVITCCQQTALRFGRAEQLRTACILHTADNLRRCGEEVIAVSAEEHGAQVVSLLHHNAFTVEVGGDVAILRNHLTLTAGLRHQGRVSIERAEVRPVLFTTLRLLILELDVVEVVLVLVEAVDGDGDKPAALVVLAGIGVHHPLVARCRDVHRSSLTQEVDVEGHFLPDMIGIGT